ncbi:MAG: hypothetical protein E6I43_13500 [Chloroflexi bacterium]|nr:MAG: hypothetical protein E6I43_13500 [Chloroflexota bacterium]
MLLLLSLWFGLITVAVFAHWLNLRATTTARVIAADGPHTGAYQYAYVIAERSCLGTASAGPPLPEPSETIQIHYDPSNICDSMIDPAGQLAVLLIAELVFGPLLALMVVACWPRKSPE